MGYVRLWDSGSLLKTLLEISLGTFDINTTCLFYKQSPPRFSRLQACGEFAAPPSNSGRDRAAFLLASCRKHGEGPAQATVFHEYLHATRSEGDLKVLAKTTAQSSNAGWSSPCSGRSLRMGYQNSTKCLVSTPSCRRRR